MNENYLKELGDQIALTHWAQSNEKTYEEICDRVVNYICDDQSEEGRNYNKRMKDLLKSKKFIPNSPCWINSGTDMKNLFACYVIDLKDNMNSIMDAAKRMAMIMKEGGGVGVSLTPIRAEGSRVGGEDSNRTASGPISFLKVFDAVVGAVKSAGVRRGAALANLKTGHPDLIKFIKCKEDQNQINNFNLSVAITDAFMEDVIQNRHTVWAKDENDRCYTAAEIYDMIVEHMWNNGEPGVQFIDTVNNVDGKYTGRPEFREFNTGIEVSNPCVTGNTVLMTKEGNFPIEELVGKEVQVWNGDSWSKPVVPFSTGINPIVKVTIKTYQLRSDPNDDNFDPNNDGDRDITLFCTPYHKFILAHSMQRVKAEDLKGGEELLSPNCPGYDDRDYYISDVEWLGGEAPTYCLTEPDNHAMTLICDGVPVLTSQCGETFLKPNEACNLASINLYHFVNPFWKGKDENKDMALRQELKQTVEDAVEFLNKMLDKSETPFPEINEVVKQFRKVGLGVMGLADYLSAKGIVYGSPEAVHEAADVFAFISKTAEEYSLRKGYKNATLTVQAPTGTTGLVGEVSTGIEPHFLRCWTRHSLKMGDLLMYPKSLRDYIVSGRDNCRTSDHNYMCWVGLERAMKNSDMEKFSNLVEGREYYTDDHSISNEIKRYWPTAHEVTPKQHLAMLAAIQRHVHNSVSKTINLPHDATVDDVRELITTAWRSGCKGFTCYRDGSRDSQPLKSIDKKDSDKKFEEIVKSVENGETAFIPRSEYDELLRRAKILEELNDSVDFDLPTCIDMVKAMRESRRTIVDVDEYDLLEKKAAAFDKLNANLPPTLMPKEYILANAGDVTCKCTSSDTVHTADEEEICESDKELLRKVHSNEWMLVKHERFVELVEKAKTVDRMEKLISRLPARYLPANALVKDFAKDMDVPNKNLPCKRPRPDTTYGETVKTKIGCGSIYITVNKDENGTCEVFTNLGRAGGCPSQSEATCRLISLALRSGVKVEDVIDQLKGIRCMNTMRQGGIKQADGTVVLSCPDAIGKAIEKFHKADMEDGLFIGKMRDCTPEETAAIERCLDKTFVPTGINILDDVMKCPDCGKPLARDGGCVICRHCGYSKCG